LSETVSKDGKKSGSDENSTSQDNKTTPAVNSPVQELARSLMTYIVNKKTEDLVEATAFLLIETSSITAMSTSVTIA
jgi:hypothetical protein